MKQARSAEGKKLKFEKKLEKQKKKTAAEDARKMYYAEKQKTRKTRKSGTRKKYSRTTSAVRKTRKKSPKKKTARKSMADFEKDMWGGF